MITEIGWLCALAVAVVCAILWANKVSSDHARLIAVCETQGGYLVYDAKANWAKTLCVDEAHIKELRKRD